MGGKGSGRRTKLEEIKDSMEVLRGAAGPAAQYLRDVVNRKVKKPSWARIRVCEFILEHILGKPPQRHEITGAGGQPLTLLQLAILAELGEAPPRESLIEAGVHPTEETAKTPTPD